MLFKNYFSKQARKPSGIYGRFFMSRVFEKGNIEVNALLYDTLSIEPDDHVLEIGFGTGLLINRLARKIENGLIEGIDFSKSMVAMAEKKNKKYINAGKVKLHTGDFDEAVFDENYFDKIFTVNTVYFWKEPKSTIARLYRILKPGGKLMIGFIDKREMEKMPLNLDVFQYYSTQDIAELLSHHNSINNVEIISRQGKKTPCYCAVGTK